jgi:hypothetical protein
MMGAPLQPGFDSHISPCGTELVIFDTDAILPCYVLHYKAGAVQLPKPVPMAVAPAPAAAAAPPAVGAFGGFGFGALAAPVMAIAGAFGFGGGAAAVAAPHCYCKGACIKGCACKKQGKSCTNACHASVIKWNKCFNH